MSDKVIHIEFDEAKEKKPLKPKTVSQVSLAEVGKEIEIPDGHALVVPLDSEGKEVQGKHWFYPLRNVEKIYGDKSKYVIKKKVTQ